MPKIPLSEEQKKDDLFRGYLKFHMETEHLDKRRLAERTGIKYSTLCERLREPGTFKREDLMSIFKVLRFTTEEKGAIW